MHRRSGSAVLTAAVRADNRDGDGFPLSLTMTATSMMAAMMVTPPLMVTLCPSPPPMPATITVTLTTMPLMLVMVVVQMPDRRAVPGAWSLGASLRDRATLPSPLRGLGPSGGYPSRLRSLRSLRADACPAARSAHRRVPHRRRRRYVRRYPPLQCRGGLALALRAPASAPRPALVPAPVRTLPPAPPAACCARLPPARSASPPTQSPRRLPSAGFAGVDSPFALPRILGCFYALRRVVLTPDAPVVPFPLVS